MRSAFIVAATVLFFIPGKLDAKIPLAIPVCMHGTTAIIKSTEKTPGISDLKIKQVEKLLGRRLTLKEKIIIKIYQWKNKRGINQENEGGYKDKGKTALTFGIISLVSLLLFPVGFFDLLPAFVFGLAAVMLGKKAKKEKPGDKKARTAIILGWITLGIITAAVLFIIAFLASIHGSDK